MVIDTLAVPKTQAPPPGLVQIPASVAQSANGDRFVDALRTGCRVRRCRVQNAYAVGVSHWAPVLMSAARLCFGCGRLRESAPAFAARTADLPHR